jgi:hypothetical protein
VPGRLGVDDDEVVVPLADLVGELADGEDLLHARRGVGDEVERPRQRADPADERQPDEDPEVLAERVLGVHRHREEVLVEAARSERQRPRVECRRECSLRIHLADERPLAGARAELGQRSRDGGLADAALARDEEQLPLEQVHRVGRPQPPKPMRRSPSFVPTSM